MAERPPSGADTLLPPGTEGWMIHETGWTSIVAILSSSESVIFAGTGDALQCQQFAEDFLRFGADPMNLR